jgi:DNA polymerase III epsilon subunit-like protein
MFPWIGGAGGRGPAQDTALEALRYVVLDTEFTALDPRSSRLLAVGAVAMDGGRIRLGEQFYRVVNPGVAVPPSSVLVHGLRPADVEAGDSPPLVMEHLVAFTGEAAVLVGHFIDLDRKVLWKEMGAAGRHRLAHPAVDTARVHRFLLRHMRHGEDVERRLEQVDLVTLAREYDIDFEHVHHALGDAFVTARLWQKMLGRLARRGVRTWGGLRRIGGV